MSKEYLGTWAGAIVRKSEIWFSNFNFNGLFKFDIDKMKCYFIKKFEHADVAEEGLHFKAYTYKEYVYFIPSKKTKYVSVLNTETTNIEYLELPVETDGLAYKDDNCIYIKSKGNFFYVIDCEKKCFLNKRECPYVCKNEKDKSCYKERINGNHYFKIDMRGRDVIDINMDSWGVSHFRIEGKIKSINNIFIFEKKYWLTREDAAEILSIDENNKISVYNVNREEWLIDEHIVPYGNMFEVNNNLWVMGYYLDGIYRVDMKNRILENIFNRHKDYRFDYGVGYGAVYNNICVQDDIVYFLPQRSRELLCFNYRSKSVKKVEFCVGGDEIPYYKEIIHNRINNKIFIEGYRCMKFEDYIKDVVSL